jgi:uncharacterized protein YkwD
MASASPPSVEALVNCNADPSLDSEEREFLRLINVYRNQSGLPPLALSENLNRAAAWKANHMAVHNYFAHDDTPIGRTWGQRIRDCGYTLNTFRGENLAAGNGAAAAAFEQWRNSPGHNANMLSPNFRVIGIGRAYNASSTYDWYWATDFGGASDGAGDVSCSDGLNPIDAALILQYAAGLSGGLPCASRGDMNADGRIDAADALMVLQFSAG